MLQRRAKQKFSFWIVSTAVFGLVFLSMIENGWLYSWHLKFSNFLYRQTENEASQDIVIVAIDDKSLARKNASELRTLQFSKSDYARVLENLESAGAKAIGVDIIFSEKSTADDEKALIETLKTYDNIILAAEAKTPRTTGLKPLSQFIKPHPENVGSILFETDRDNLIRRQRIEFDDEVVPYSFALQLARLDLGVKAEEGLWLKRAYQVMPFAIRLGNEKIEPIQIPVDRDRKMMLNFFGPPQSFQTISFVDALEENFIDRKTGKTLFLKDKTILIGEMGTGLHDEQYVPTSLGKPMPGVEIHANAIQTILSRHFLREQAIKPTFYATLIALTLGFALFLSVRITWSMVFLILGLVGYTLATWVAFEYGLILNTLYPYVAYLLAFAVAYVYRYFTESRYAKQTENAFSKYVSHQVVQKILENPKMLKLGGEKREMTVLFSDIAGFTTISEKSEAEALVEQLNEYLDAMTSIIIDNEGTLDKYIGDAVMAFWNAPLDLDNHAERACLTALAYQEKNAELRKKWESEGKPLFYARIGLNTGPMVVGNIGSHRRFDYTVIGDSVNLGARLEGVNKFFDTSIIISETTFKEAKYAIEARELDRVAVKGKAKPVTIYELQARKGELSDLQKKLNAEFKKALELYRHQQWDKAILGFKNCLNIQLSDGASKTYIDRCEHLKIEKLPKNWDGSYTLKTK